MLVRRQIKVRQIPVCEGPNKLCVNPYPCQHKQKQGRHSEDPETHTVEENRAPVIDRPSGLCL